jgi:hypothetical protein
LDPKREEAAQPLSQKLNGNQQLELTRPEGVSDDWCILLKAR